jgi:sodium/potassium/calcium exchanger 1
MRSSNSNRSKEDEDCASKVYTKHGIYRRKYKLRAAFQSMAFVTLVAGFCIYNRVFNNEAGAATSFLKKPAQRGENAFASTSTGHAENTSSSITPRRLFEENVVASESGPDQSTHSGSESKYRGSKRELSELVSCDSLDKADPGWVAVFYGIGVLYMFLALAIVCDEFFVPALEEISSTRHLDLSMDVAGATLMAAGGSAPELFASLFGTFTESEIGFGTIIGSAVFNVLFVIAMCSIFSKELLRLTWWPLFRDSTFYIIGLIVLAIFVGVTTPEEIMLWEACVLFSLYIIYILIMWKNAAIYKFLTGKEIVYPEDPNADDEAQDYAANATAEPSTNSTSTGVEMVAESPESATAAGTAGSKATATVAPSEEPEPERPSLSNKSPSATSMTSAASLGNLKQNLLRGMSNNTFDFRWQGTFRAGILKLLRDPGTWVETGGVGIVAKIAGDADYVFQKIDQNGDGHIDKQELKHLFNLLECRVSDHELDEVFAILDENGDGVISEEEFNKWYTTSAELIRSQVRKVFDSIDVDNSGTIDSHELKALLLELDPRVTDEDVALAIDSMYQHGDKDAITFEEFEEWYEKSIIYVRQKKAVEEDREGAFESLKPPYGESTFSWIQYVVVFPLVFVMVMTIPDVRRPGWGRWCYVSFAASIAWIGGFSYLMVDWTEIIGNTVGIPSVIMGLTVLAAGTSVPDLLSSVIVARRGAGDMAVSSSIGSNIFDILVGLPVPWFLYLVWPGKPDRVEIGADNLWILIFVLIGMLMFVIAAIHCQGWALTKTLAGMMLCFYVGFLVIAITLELPFEMCTDN